MDKSTGKVVIDILNTNFFDWNGQILYKGGAERYVLDLAELIREMGYDARIIQYGNFYFEKEIRNFQVIGLPAESPHEKLSEYYGYKFSHSKHTICSPLELACGFPMDGRSIGISHGIHWDGINNELSALRDDRHQNLFESLKRVDAAVCVDTNFINWVRTYDYKLSEKLIYIPNYYDPQQFKYEEKVFSDNEIVILYPRRFCTERGFYLTLSLVDHVLKKHENVKFHFVGQGNAGESELVKRYLDRYPDKIQFHELDMSEMHRAYADSQIVLIPSVSTEGTSLSCIEAMAMNNAVIATNVGGLTNLIIDSFNGLIASPNEEELLKKVEHLIGNREERLRLAKNAAETVKVFRKETWQKKWMEVITDFLNRTGRLSLIAERESFRNRLNDAMAEKKKLESMLNQVTEEKEILVPEREDLRNRLNETTVREKILERKLEQVTGEKESLVSEKEELRGRLNEVRAEKEAIWSELNYVYSGDVWKLAKAYYRVRNNNIFIRSAYRIAKNLKARARNSKYLYNLGKFRYYSRHFGIGAALRKSFHKLSESFPRRAERPSSPFENISGKSKHCLNEMGINKAEELAISREEFFKLNPESLKRGSKPDVICFPITDWFFRFQRSQHICSQFAKNGSRVFYINPVFLGKNNKPQWNLIQDGIFDSKLASERPLNIYKDKIDQSSLNIMTSSLDTLAREMAIVDAICLVQLPFWFPLAKKIKELFGWKIIYDCMDEHSGFSTNNDSMLREEDLLINEADLIMTTSRILDEKIRKKGRLPVLIPNAADFDYFSKLIPNDSLKHLNKPIIGYYGAISDWFDNELVEYLAEKRRDWEFVLIGHTFGSDISKLKKMSNVHFLGEKPYVELTKYLYWFDVCIIPFKLNRLTEATNPVKFFEYISSGKKVVSVQLPELAPYSEFLYMAKGNKEFLEKIEGALGENDSELIHERMKIAKENTWEKRYEDIWKEIKKLYPKVSIIIITYNNLDYTKMCIESILTRSEYPNLEIIVVDNNSSDKTPVYLSELASSQPDVKIILNEFNAGFAKANNMGLRVSSGEYIILLNNDTIVTRGWVSKLLNHLNDKNIGLVGPVTNFCGNEAKVQVSYESINEFERFHEVFLRKYSKPTYFEIHMLAMYCVAMRKEIQEEIGYLDENYGLGLFEDDDYSHRMKLKGYKIACAQDVFIHHFGETSFKKLKQSDKYRQCFEKNRKYFEEKFGLTWQPHKYRFQNRKPDVTFTRDQE